MCCELRQPVWETQAYPSRRCLGLRALEVEPGWPQGMCRAAHSNFGTAAPDSCCRHRRCPVWCSWGARKVKVIGSAAGMPGKSRSSATESRPGSSGGAGRWEAPHEAGSGWGLLALGPQGGHTAGTWQGHNKCLLNLFPCCVWRPVALWAVAAPPPPGPHPSRSSRNPKVR